MLRMPRTNPRYVDYTLVPRGFLHALEAMDRNSAIRLANQAIAADPEIGYHSSAFYIAFPLAFILAHEGRSITQDELELLNHRLNHRIQGDDVLDAMYTAAERKAVELMSLLRRGTG
jgi:hypothetical protein